MPEERETKELLGGTVESAKVYAERTDREVTKMMKVIAITRTPQTLIARCHLDTKAHLYALEIDEPTVRALAKMFDDFRAKHPEGKAPPSPLPWDPHNNGHPISEDDDTA
jgi:hypothetical protein